jgi:nitrite reductase/ring-hydroxylating ferredoxin subunit
VIYLRKGISLLTVLLVFLSGSCTKKANDVIPDVYVHFVLDINDPQFVTLNAIGGADTIDANTNNWDYAGGFDGNGIIIYRGIDSFYAYDRTCPHDYKTDGESVKVNIDFIQAVCPVCGTVYELAAGGTPSSGPGRYPLKNYRTVFDGRFVTVSNY